MRNPHDHRRIVAAGSLKIPLPGGVKYFAKHLLIKPATHAVVYRRYPGVQHFVLLPLTIATPQTGHVPVTQ
jgi:hypothetical protein